jgi:MYXO-CTERM domain-containing protein
MLEEFRRKRARHLVELCLRLGRVAVTLKCSSFGSMTVLRLRMDRLLSCFMIGCVLILPGFFSSSACAQGTLTFVQTGGGVPLVSASSPLLLPVNVPGVILGFQFGFSTDELLSPGGFSDAVTAGLLGTSNLFLPLATADVSGTVWAPGGMGTVPIGETEIIRQAISYPSTAPAFAFKEAWAVSVLVPSAFPPGPVTFTFDLFDNSNPLASVAWFSGLTLTAIPEPEPFALAALGLVALWFLCRRAS